MDHCANPEQGSTTSHQWRADDRSSPPSISNYPPALGANARTIHREDAMFMTQKGISAPNLPSIPPNPMQPASSSQFYPTHVRSYVQHAPSQSYHTGQSAYPPQRIQTLPPPNALAGGRNFARPQTAPNRGPRPQAQGGFQRREPGDVLAPIAPGQYFPSERTNGLSAPVAFDRPELRSSSPPGYPLQPFHSHEVIHNGPHLTSSPQEMENPTPLLGRSYLTNPYLQRPRQESSPPMSHSSNLNSERHDAGTPRHNAYFQRQGSLPPVPPFQVVPNPYLQPPPQTVPNPYLQHRRQESLSAQHSPQPSPNPYLHMQETVPSATYRSPQNAAPVGATPSQSLHGLPEALISGVQPAPPIGLVAAEHPTAQLPLESPSPEDEEFARVLALSQSEETERKRLQDELAKQEEDDLTRALAESMLSPGIDPHGAATNPFFLEPGELATSSKSTLASRVLSKADIGPSAWNEGSEAKTPPPKLDYLPDLAGWNITGFDDLSLKGLEKPATLPDGTGDQSLAGTTPPFSKDPEVPLGDAMTVKGPALGTTAQRFTDDIALPSSSAHRSMSEAASPKQLFPTPIDIQPDDSRPSSPSDLAYYQDETPLPSPLPPQVVTLSPCAANDTVPDSMPEPEPDMELPPKYSPPPHDLPRSALIPVYNRSAAASLLSAAVPTVVTTQSPSLMPQTLSDPSHSPVSSVNSIPVDTAGMLGAPLARIASNISVRSEESAKNARPMNANHFIDADLLLGVSISFESPIMTDKLRPMKGLIPNIVSLPYGRCPPLHIQAPSWKHMLKLLARMSSTKFEPTIQAQAITKADLKLRTVIQFVKPLDNYPQWRTILWFKIDHPVPNEVSDAHKWMTSNPNMLPYAFTLNALPRILQNATDGPVSKTYTIPATEFLPYPTLPISCPDLALYLQAALDFSRSQKDDNSGFKKLAKMVNICYPNQKEDTGLEGPDKSTVGALFKRVIGRKDKKGKGKTNNETYEFITPFVPDEWG